MTRPPSGPDAGADDGDPPVAVPGQDSAELSRSVILQTALAIVDRDGADRLSIRRLSDALGRDPVMLYRHVPNKATSSTNCRRSSSGPRKPTTYSGSVCTGSPSSNSPYCVRWHRSWPRTTAPPNSTASSICCFQA